MANATLSKDEILEAIGNMSVIELTDLIEAFKTKFNVTIAAVAAGGAARNSFHPHLVPLMSHSLPSLHI